MVDRVKGSGLKGVGPTLHPVEMASLGTSSLAVVVGAGIRGRLVISSAAVYSDVFVCVMSVLLFKRECEVVSLMMPRMLWLSSSNSSKLASFSCHRPDTQTLT